MSIKEERNANETNPMVRSFTVEVSMEERANGRVYFLLPNGKRYYINSDTDEVYLAKD